MAFWDNPQMVINHIRHSCVTSDDTGMSEMVIVNDENDLMQTKQRRKIGEREEITDFNDYSQSFDIAVSPGVMGRTPKFNRNDRRRRSRQENQCKNIRWNDQNEKMPDTDRDSYFKLKDFNESIVQDEKRIETSGLSLLLKESSTKSNRYVEYAKFNGEGLDNSVKHIEFFLSFLPNEEERLQPFPITIIESACIQDVIGLVLYKYIAEGGTYRVQEEIKAYSLHIAEEDGEVDMDFQALDEKEPISKFGFQHLALVEKYKVVTEVKDSVDVKIYVPHNGYSVVKFDRTDVKMKAVLSKLIKKRGMKMKAGRDYQLEKRGNEGQYVDMETTLESQGTFTFNLVRAKKSDEKENRTDEKDLHTKTSSTQDEILSMQYKSYHVMMTHRLLTSTEVVLGIHGKSIEIDPVILQKSPKFWTKIKPVSLDVDNIADCEISEEKSSGRSSFRIYYKKTDDFKHYDFETDKHIANEIVSKIYNILKSRSQTVRSEFLAKVPMKPKKGRWK